MRAKLPKYLRWHQRARCYAMVAALAMASFAMPALSLDLLTAYEGALAHDSTLRAARAAADAARERVPQAQAQLRPNVSLSASRMRNDLSRSQSNLQGQSTTADEQYISYNQTLQLRQALIRKTLWSGLEQARFFSDEADATLEREVHNLGVRLTGAYLDALLAQDQLDLVVTQQSFHSTQLNAARRALVAGSGTRTDIDEAQARLDMNLAQELEARQQLDYSRHQLALLVGQPLDPLARLDARKLQLIAPDSVGLEAWLARAQQHSPEIRALQARVEVARMEVEKARSGHYPTLDAIAQISRSASENVTSPSSSYSNQVIGLQLNVPLYAGGFVDSTVRQALAEQLRAAETLEAARRDLALRLHREYRTVTEGVLKIRALEQALKSAEQLLTSNRRSFVAGSRTMVDILNADQNLQTVLRDLAQARYTYLMGRVRLNALAGVDESLVIREINGVLTTE